MANLVTILLAAWLMGAVCSQQLVHANESSESGPELRLAEILKKKPKDITKKEWKPLIKKVLKRLQAPNSISIE